MSEVSGSGPVTSLADASNLLIRLLQSETRSEDGDFILVTCCVCVIEHTLLRMASNDGALALDGLERLFVDVRRHFQQVEKVI